MKYQRYAELTAQLQEWAAARPDLCRLESLGRSPEGREMWSMTLTCFATGDDRTKPAYHVNGQHHAGEVTAAAVAMYGIGYLLEQYGQEPRVTELLDSRALYVVPRVAVDGAEWYFDHPQILRSSPLLYPEVEEPEGLRPADIDGDGQIRQMRIPHPQGEWKISEADSRLMLRRRPEEHSGAFYRIYTEGLMMRRSASGSVEPDWDGRAVGPSPGRPYATERGFDFNRNYPANWRPQYRQPGSGRYPFDRPEVRALAEFWLRHPNIGAAMSYHTFAGLNLRPSPLLPDEKLNPADLVLYKEIGELCTRITGYPTVNVYEFFTSDYDPDRLDVGSWLEWCYDEKGVMGFEMELWDWPYIAGVPKRALKERKKLSDDERAAEELLKLGWNDRELDGKGFKAWTPWQHPQLGSVEVGGWDPKWVVQNPPERLLEQECRKNARFLVEHGLALPLLAIGAVRLRPVGGGCCSLAVEVLNRGFLPTQVTEVALAQREVQPVEARLTLSGGVRLVGGKTRQELGQISGRGSGGRGVWGDIHSPATSAWAEWVLQGRPGERVRVEVSHRRAGKVATEVTL